MVVSKPTTKKLAKKWKQKKELELYQAELIVMLDWLRATGKRLVVLVEGRDTAGKGRFIKAFLKHLNPKHAKTVALSKPSSVESNQNYVQRYMQHLPANGNIALYDRSYYNRAMVEPVLGFCSEEAHKSFMKIIPSFEDLITYDGDTIFVKLYFSISKETQEKRLKAREGDPLRGWKISTADKQALDKYDDYTGAKYRMLKKTSTDKHPWHIVRADKRRKSKLHAIKHILSLIDYEGKSKELDFSVPEGAILSGQRELQLMKDQKKNLGRFAE